MRTMIRLIKNSLSARAAGLIIGLIIVFSYAIFETNALVLGPKLKVLEPAQEYLTTSSSTLTIAGQAKRIATIYLNGRQIFTDKNGQFAEEVVLLPGYNILRIDIWDKFDRRITKRFQVWRTNNTSFN